MIIEFMYYGKDMSGGSTERLIPILDKRGKVHLGKWGAFDEAMDGFTTGLHIDYSFAIRNPNAIWVPSPIYSMTDFGLKNCYTKYYHEPACAIIERVKGKGSRVYLVTDKDPEMDELVPLTYREALARRGLHW